RGCPFSCKFCLSSFHNSPFRNRSYENIKSVIDEGIIYSKFETISLIGSCVSIHPNFKQVCEYIINKSKRLTIPSVRIEHLTSDVIDVLEMGDIKTITIAPETGSENLRYALGKIISNEKILNVLSQIRESKIRNVKFYFIIGLPNEDEKDIDEIINLLKKIDNLGFESQSLRVNINPFIPKLNTPYEKEINAYLKENLYNLISKYKKIEKELIKIRSIKLKVQNFKAIVKNARLQTMISIGDNEVSELLLNYYQNGANFGALKKAENDLGFSFDNYLLKLKGCYSPWKI
ncbi:MAG TPA: B12-binding domain-containing radical SAM protein, partial [bacterium]|nr:B12-binding domain-containing radical SAM protein [bacterium]